ncbi:MAG: hypothetical protein U0936_11510 [Planctomycetaceae bacterium]
METAQAEVTVIGIAAASRLLREFNRSSSGNQTTPIVADCELRILNAQSCAQTFCLFLHGLAPQKELSARLRQFTGLPTELPLNLINAQSLNEDLLSAIRPTSNAPWYVFLDGYS